MGAELYRIASREDAALDTTRILVLRQSLGDQRCREIVSEVVFHLTDRLGLLQSALAARNAAEAQVLASRLASLSEQVGLADFARVARDLAACLEAGDAVAVAAVGDRLMRLGEDSLFSVILYRRSIGAVVDRPCRERCRADRIIGGRRRRFPSDAPGSRARSKRDPAPCARSRGSRRAGANGRTRPCGPGSRRWGSRRASARSSACRRPTAASRPRSPAGARRRRARATASTSRPPPASFRPGATRSPRSRTTSTRSSRRSAGCSPATASSRYRAAKPAEPSSSLPTASTPRASSGSPAAARLAQDLINTPARDIGPEALEAAFVALAGRHGAEVRVTRGAAALRAANLPMIEAVGAAAAEPPRLLDLGWGRPDAPKVTLVGKGVCFDTGGLDIKPPASMGLMKKDMGGAATAMGLAEMVMGLGLDIRLRLLVPAVENAISAAAMRPGDILPSRKGLTVEVNNTDAEGRLVLADALALADEEAPELIVSLATLTGAARVALGPDVPPFFTDDEALAADLAAASPRGRRPALAAAVLGPLRAADRARDRRSRQRAHRAAWPGRSPRRCSCAAS